VEEEDPAPGKDVRDDSAQQRTDEARQRPDSREGSLDTPAFLQLVDVADDGDGLGHHAARAEPLDGAEDHQLHERARGAGERRAGEEERHRHLVGALAAVEVGELAEERHRGGGGQQVDGEDPTVAGNPAELAHRRRHRRGHGRRLQRGEEHAEQDAGGDQSAFSSRLQGDSFEASRFAGRRSGILYVPLFGARERRAYTPPREETMSQRALLLVFVPLLVLGTAAVARGQHEHGTPPQAAAAAGGDGTILDVPAVDIGAQTLAARERAQRSTVEKFRVPIDFRFTDRLAESGITFVHQIVDDAGKTYKPAHYDHGNGIAAADVDGDGLVDLYFTSQMGGNELWRNLGGGKFRNVTAEAGVGLPGRVSVTASFADIDNDGDQDLYVTTVRMGNALFENDGKGRFRDISKEAGVDYVGHSSGAVFLDYDRDGRLDLFLVNVGKYTGETKGCGGFYNAYEDAFSGHLHPERTERSVLYHNRGGNRFEDVSAAVGLVDGSWSGDASLVDFNQDGYPDLYILNMQGDDHYWENQGGKKFVDRTAEVFPKTPWGAMGIKAF